MQPEVERNKQRHAASFPEDAESIGGDLRTDRAAYGNDWVTACTRGCRPGPE